MAEKSGNVPIGQIEDHWFWKAGLRAFIILINIIAIGSAGWLLSSTSLLEQALLFNYVDFTGSTIGTIIVLIASAVWCALWIAIPLFLRPRRCLHPGVAVGLDLILWLILVFIGTWTLFSVFSIREFGSDPTNLLQYSYNYGYGYGSSSGSDGYYYLAPNGTWVFNSTESSSTIYNPYTISDDTSTSSGSETTQTNRTCASQFDSCQAQDEFVNQVWREKPTKEALATLVDVVAFLDTALHFALFVWACVDTQRRNNKKTSRAMEQVAEKIISDLERLGIVRVEDGRVMRADGGQAQPYTLPVSEQVASRQGSRERPPVGSGGVPVNREGGADAISPA